MTLWLSPPPSPHHPPPPPHPAYIPKTRLSLSDLELAAEAWNVIGLQRYVQTWWVLPPSQSGDENTRRLYQCSGWSVMSSRSANGTYVGHQANAIQLVGMNCLPDDIIVWLDLGSGWDSIRTIGEIVSGMPTRAMSRRGEVSLGTLVHAWFSCVGRNIT